ncbi:PREDICTED: PRAME family member 9/15-like [Chinchilla lanigera]|uniref:PRAME family member 9/15-like n=1 Tax=Chinchilla lanigera TaxID=34839 RepID=UPI0006967641|nr:PREDICTED: PRAME family member 9/15-like [Chinchilla lanigera]
MQRPSPVYELAKQSLLNSETIASNAVHDLPTETFHDLFRDAFMGGRNEVLKKNLQTLKAVLDRLDIQLSQKVHHRITEFLAFAEPDMGQGYLMRKMYVRDVMNSGETCIFLTSQELEAEPYSMQRLQREKREGRKLGVSFVPPMINYSSYLLKWARRRKASVHLYCEKVMIKSSAVSEILTFLQAVQLDSIHELEVFSDWGPESMKTFVPQLRKMKNLHTFRFSSLSPEVCTAPLKNNWYYRIYASNLAQLKNLLELRWMKSSSCMEICIRSSGEWGESSPAHLRLQEKINRALCFPLLA